MSASSNRSPLQRSSLDWGRNQALYRAAPGHVIYNPNTHLHEEILSWRASNDSTTSVKLVREALARELGKYPEDLRPISLDRAQSVPIELKTLEPDNGDGIRTLLHTVAFYCSTCGRLSPTGPGGTEREKRDAVTRLAGSIGKNRLCDCGGRLLQWNLLTIHECGETIHLPTDFRVKCKAHGWKQLHFLRHGSERSADWEVVCKVPGCNTRHGYEAFFPRHTACSLEAHFETEDLSGDEKNRRLRFSSSPIQKATNFLPKVLRIVNSDQLESAPTPGSSSSVAVSAGALGITGAFTAFDPDGGLRGWIESYTGGQAAESLSTSELVRLATQIADPDLRDRMLKTIRGSSTSRSLLTDGAFLDLTRNRDYVMQAASVATFKDVRSPTVARILLDPTLALEDRTRLERVPSLAQTLHLSELRHVGDIGLTSCLTGFTRGDYDPTRVRLLLYQMSDARHRVKYRVYTNTVKTEGIFVQLDPVMTLRWLNAKAESGDRLAESGTFTDDLLAIQKRFDASAILPFRPPTDNWSAFHYGLLHTISHLFLQALSEYAGEETQGLAEQLLPYQNSFILYVNQSTDFSLDGLEMAFEHSLLEILEAARTGAETCPYNPECEDRDPSACHGCVQLPETSCEHFNRLLNRRYAEAGSAGGFWA